MNNEIFEFDGELYKITYPGDYDCVAPKRGKWPGIAGISHDGALYCVDCALEMNIITERDGEYFALVRRFTDKNAFVAMDFDHAPWTGVSLADEEIFNGPEICGRHRNCVHSDGECFPVLEYDAFYVTPSDEERAAFDAEAEQ